MVDIKAIKLAIKTLLDNANVNTQNPYLSTNMAKSVKKVLTINVSRIPLQASYYPCATIFTTGKDIELSDISKNQLVGKRKGLMDFTVVGLVWYNNMSSANANIADDADSECEFLMENIEQVLRTDPTLGGTVLTSKPLRVTYHDMKLHNTSEDSYMRCGIMTLQVRLHY
jgi:hypothetical protein